MIEKRIELLSDFIFRLNDETKLEIVNEYNRSFGKSEIFMNNEHGLEKLVESYGFSIDSIFRAVSYGDYRYLDNFVMLNELSNIVSTEYIDADLWKIAEWMLYNPNSVTWTILNASIIAESGEYIYDIQDDFSYAFGINDYELVQEWMETNDDKNISDWLLVSWCELRDNYLVWVEENKK